MSAAVHLFQSYNVRLVIVGVSLLGLASGVLGVFLLLRRRSLMADAASHATLPGIALAFLIQPALGLPGKFLPGLLLGALLSGLFGMFCIQWIPRTGRIRDDAAMGIVLSVFYGFGVCLIGIILKMEQGAAGGLKGFIYGKTASMVHSDALLIAGAAVLITFITVLLYKEFKLICFDERFAGSQGWPVKFLDGLLMGAVVAVTVIGLQAVGLILMIALLVIPAASARFWTDRLSRLLFLSALFGMAGAGWGAALSAVAHNAPAGAVIVLCQGGFFFISLLFGTRRGAVPSLFRHRKLQADVQRQHLLRAFYEAFEHMGAPRGASEARIGLERLLQERSWSPRLLKRLLRRMRRAGCLYLHPDGKWGLTRDGWPLAERLVRNHRLWELFLIHYAEMAPGQVDRGADRIEHVLGPAVIAHLERLLEAPAPEIPGSPHPLPCGDGI